MSAFLLEVIEETCIVTDQQTAGHGQFWQRRVSTLDDGSCAVSNALATLEVIADVFMVFPSLKFLEGAEVRILIVQVDDQPQCQLIVFQVIKV